MKSFRQLVQELSEASLWPGTPEYKKKYGAGMPDDKDGSRHKIEKSAGVVRATRKYDAESGESEEPTKNREDAEAAPVKRGRGRPPGKYGSYKKKVKESLEILESLDSEEEIYDFINSLDEESFNELEAHLSEEKVDEKYMGAEKLASSLAAKGARDPKALAAWIGRKKYGKEAFQKAAAKGEKMGEEVEVTEELKGGQHRIDVNKNGKLDAEDFKKLRSMKKKPDGTLHNCATHVEHTVYGKGECIKEAHAESDEAGNIAWYTVKFNDGSIRKMQTESMKIVVSESHKHESVEVKEEQIDESVNRYAAFISTENK